MAFTDFKSPAEVQTAYQITACEEHFLDIMPKAPSERFLDNFKFTTTYFDVFSSEASRCENVIYPLLLEASRHIVSDYSLWSHKSIVADATLSGTPDYIIASRSKLGKNVFGLPLVLVVEAKQNDFTKGWGQCLAELVAAQKLNEQPDYPVYGIVTDGELWQFGKLHETQFTQEVTRSTIDDIEKVFGSLYAVIQLVIKGASSN
ncbi:MAG: hypothetical protein VSS75_000615 [Candidatus Parabeggiatoa sp.]|nr:hypothetical protein [Candidatus Parabeggiatoa sp.]